MHKILLNGCKSRPLAGYLKSLAVLRLIAEQTDPDVMGRWEADTFVVESELTPDGLLDFFCNDYVPTPIITPWNGGSGFYPNDSKEGISAILESSDPRFGIYREAIGAVTAWPEWAKELDTPEAVITGMQRIIEETNPGKKQTELKKLLNVINPPPDIKILKSDRPAVIESLEKLKVIAKDKGVDKAEAKALNNWLANLRKAVTKYSEYIRQKNKEIVLPLCRSRLPDECVKWLDAVYAIHEDGRLSHHQILGTGGNDARQEFGNNFIKQIAQLLIKNKPGKTSELLSGALFETPLAGMPEIKIGQFDPGKAGGYNQGMGVETKDFKTNPWDYILSLEGALMMSSAIARRQSVGRSALTSPFSARFSPVGFTSSEYTESGGTETWLPLWHQPAKFNELRHLFGEGRSSIGRRQAASGLEFSRAVASLGVDRGIVAFERYSYLKRRGDTHVGLPAGRIPVKYQPGIELLTELDPITGQLDLFFRGFKNIPASFAIARKQIDEAIFACSLNSGPYQFMSLVRTIGRMNRLTGMRDLRKAPKLNRPLHGLSPAWISYCDDGSVEIRIAAAIASIMETGKIGPIMSNLAGASSNTPWRWDENKDQQCWVGGDIAERLANLLAYRIMDAKRNSLDKIPLAARLHVHAEDVMPFLNGLCDDNKIDDLLWGFATINWRRKGLNDVRSRWHQAAGQSMLSRTWCLLKLLHTPYEVEGKKLRYETRISRLLLAGRIAEACEASLRRLRISELNPHVVHYGNQYNGVRLLASLLIPIKHQGRLASLVLKT